MNLNTLHCTPGPLRFVHAKYNWPPCKTRTLDHAQIFDHIFWLQQWRLQTLHVGSNKDCFRLQAGCTIKLTYKAIFLLIVSVQTNKICEKTNAQCMNMQKHAPLSIPKIPLPVCAFPVELPSWVSGEPAVDLSFGGTAVVTSP